MCAWLLQWQLVYECHSVCWKCWGWGISRWYRECLGLPGDISLIHQLHYDLMEHRKAADRQWVKGWFERMSFFCSFVPHLSIQLVTGCVWVCARFAVWDWIPEKLLFHADVFLHLLAVAWWHNRSRRLTCDEGVVGSTPESSPGPFICVA